jgi:hypothetical protein
MLQKRVRHMLEVIDVTYESPVSDYVLWAPPGKVVHISIFPCHVDAR